MFNASFEEAHFPDSGVPNTPPEGKHWEPNETQRNFIQSTSEVAGAHESPEIVSIKAHENHTTLVGTREPRQGTWHHLGVWFF